MPIDLGAVGDAAATAAQGATESATGAVEGLTGVTETLPGGAAGVTDCVAGAAEGVSASAVDSAAQVLPDLTAAVGSANPSSSHLTFPRPPAIWRASADSATSGG